MSMMTILGVDGILGQKYQSYKQNNEINQNFNKINAAEDHQQYNDDYLPLSYQPVHDNVVKQQTNFLTKDAFIDSLPVQWCHKRYNPIDLRDTYPIVHPKSHEGTLWFGNQLSQQNWQLDTEESELKFDRSDEDCAPYVVTQQHARCQDWSTLRQMLPSTGNRIPILTPKWGTNAYEDNISFTTGKMEGFNHLNSEMTTFVDDAHVNNKRFELF